MAKKVIAEKAKATAKPKSIKVKKAAAAPKEIKDEFAPAVTGAVTPAHVVTSQSVELNTKSVVQAIEISDVPGFHVEQPDVKPGISVVIPYLASAASGHEILYALRAWAENFPEGQIIIIGDRPDFISDQVIHIPHVAEFKSPQLDVTAKLIQAIASELVTEDFILTNDDIYPVNPVELADIAELKCAGFLGNTKKNANPLYKAKLNRTLEILLGRKLPTYDYSTHTPFLFNKTRLAKVIARYKADQEPLLVSSLYFNTCFPKDIPQVIKGGATGDLIAYVYRANPDQAVLESAFINRKFINHNSEGYTAVLPMLEKFFPEKSRFEL